MKYCIECRATFEYDSVNDDDGHCINCGSSALTERVKLGQKDEDDFRKQRFRISIRQGSIQRWSDDMSLDELRGLRDQIERLLRECS